MEVLQEVGDLPFYRQGRVSSAAKAIWAAFLPLIQADQEACRADARTVPCPQRPALDGTLPAGSAPPPQGGATATAGHDRRTDATVVSGPPAVGGSSAAGAGRLAAQAPGADSGLVGGPDLSAPPRSTSLVGPLRAWHPSGRTAIRCSQWWPRF